MTPTVFAALATAVAVGGFVQGTIGFGFALIVAPIAIALAPDLIPTTVLVLMIPLSLYVIARERGAIDLASAGWVTLGRVVGTFAGLAVLLLLSPERLRVLVGLSTLAAALASLLAPSFLPGRRACAVAGAVTGVTETATGIGGPPLALVFQHAPGPVLRTTVALCFLLGQALSVAILALVGRITTVQLWSAVLLALPLSGGAYLSRFAHGALDARTLRWAVLGFAIASGAWLVL
ncbi:sulfite exporter TauE/SafE family protein [Methylobacterium terricola]|uniref:Probable membrane transporter protein n=1 Tax=Methylobacterium terricola TaxID=2583531 RepID=A0A5C4L5Q4_9HYPH|nr:sulfite exporter TauE/SafE family protein [Methylobacterium terricola]TNC06642.1 sulfite exporter TauE/SafE family protein [Methylobacterium terricola]